MIHTSNFKPVVIPVFGDTTRNEIDRLQDMNFSVATNRTKIKEIGRDGAVGFRSNIPTINGSLKQLEMGSIAFWNELANKASTTTLLTLNDFKTSMIDILGFKTDDSGTFLGTVQYPNLRTAGFNISIGDPSANAERSYTLVGEDELFWQNGNKYVIFLKDTSCTTTSHSIIIGSGSWATYPEPVLDPDVSAKYILKVVRVRAGVSTELVEGVDYSYNSGTKTIDVSLSGTPSVSGDIYKVWYTAATYISAVDPFTVNDSDMTCLPAENCSIYLATTNYLYRLQSVSIDVSFERNDQKEIGNSEVVARGIKSKTVNVTLGRTLETYTIEEVLRGKAGLSWGKIDPREFTDNLKLIVKMYSDKDKGTFKIGYSSTDLAATSLDATVPLDDYEGRTVTLSGETLNITNVEGSL
jgi:hypothetical protein